MLLRCRELAVWAKSGRRAVFRQVIISVATAGGMKRQ